MSIGIAYNPCKNCKEMDKCSICELTYYRKGYIKSPTANAVEVRHGEWKLEHETYGKMRCSICEKECPIERKPDPYEDYQMTDFYVTSPYCPNCGAKMGGERREQNEG